MRVVSNSSALINLARVGKLTLLRELFGVLIVPDAVWQEVVVEGRDNPGRTTSDLPTGSRGNPSLTCNLCKPSNRTWMRGKRRPLPFPLR